MLHSYSNDLLSILSFIHLSCCTKSILSPLHIHLIFQQHSISWEYNPETQRLSIDDYETRRPYRRNGGEMVLTREERDSLLRREWEVSRADIASAIRETLKIKHQRRHTVQNLSKEPVEVLMERAAHGIRRSLLFQSSTSQELQRLEQQYVAAQKAREAVSTTVPELPRRPQTITIHEDDGLLMNPDDDDDDVPLTLEDEADFASQSKEAVARDEQGRGQCTNEAPSSRLCEA